MKILAIDPGKKGGVCLYSAEGVEVQPLPYADSSVDVSALMRIIDTYKPDVVVIERQVMYKGQGAKSSATTMTNYGQLLAIAKLYCTCYEGLWPAKLITPLPKDWQSEIIPDAARGETKEASVSYVTTHYPEVSLLRTPRSKVPCDGLADAVCIAEWAHSYT